MQEPPGFGSRMEGALALLRACNHPRLKPVIFSSFGKDSLCLLSLMREAGLDLDVAYFELGAIPAAHRFARGLISLGALRVTVLKAHSTLLVVGEHGFDAAYCFRLSSGDSVEIVGATFDDSASSELRCGLRTGVKKASAHPPYDWNLIVTGRRRADWDPTLGSLATEHSAVTLAHGTEILMPILDWSDEDVAFYLIERGDYRPDPERYEISNGTLRNRTGTEANPDHVPICIRCLAAQSGQVPHCPLALPEVADRHRLTDASRFVSGEVPATVML